MAYAVLQRHPDPPAVEQLVRAFRALPELTDTDAVQACRDAYGILVRGRSLESARILQQALSKEGVETAVVDQARLPRPPHPKPLRRADLSEAGVAAYDLYGRQHLIAWERITILAAGTLEVTETHRRLRREVQYRGWVAPHPAAVGGVYRTSVWKVEKSRDQRTDLRLDVLFDGAPRRYRINGRRFNYEGLGARRGPRAAGNYVLLVGEFLERAPGAWLNIGAAALRDGSGTTYAYPSPETFEEEVTWLCWQVAGCPGVVA